MSLVFREFIDKTRTLLAESPVYTGTQNLGGPVVPVLMSPTDTAVPNDEPFHTKAIRANANISTATMYLYQASQFMEAAAQALADSPDTKADDLAKLVEDLKKVHKRALNSLVKG